MFRMSAQIPIQAIPHMDEFFCHHDLKRPRSRQVDTWQIDQDVMVTVLRVEPVGPTDRRTEPSPKPRLERRSLGRHKETIARQVQAREIALQMNLGLGVVDTPAHSGLHSFSSKHHLRHDSTASSRGIVHHSALPP